MAGNIISRAREQRYYCLINMKCKTNIEEGIKDINIACYCYLLIMAYGMLVRYNAHKWESFIDRKKSKESTLIELSQ